MVGIVIGVVVDESSWSASSNEDDSSSKISIEDASEGSVDETESESEASDCCSCDSFGIASLLESRSESQSWKSMCQPKLSPYVSGVLKSSKVPF